MTAPSAATTPPPIAHGTHALPGACGIVGSVGSKLGDAVTVGVSAVDGKTIGTSVPGGSDGGLAVTGGAVCTVITVGVVEIVPGAVPGGVVAMGTPALAAAGDQRATDEAAVRPSRPRR